MIDRDKKINIIRLKSDEKIYYPDSSEHEDWMGDNYVKCSQVNIPLGASRYGGPVVDLPEGIDYPINHRFAAQIDLANASKFDSYNLLPRKGQLFFFASIRNNSGQVIFTKSENDKLKRVIVEHEDDFWSGVLITDFFPDTESISERIIKEKKKSLFFPKTIKRWDYFAGSEKSKIFGIFTHCQHDQEYIEKITSSDKIVLLQIGEDGFNDEGVFTVLIRKSDLENENFDNCEFIWAQS
jgi:uncharacterized protein YwqG